MMEKKIIVVSGLPRSGTSMAMQMLKAGGMEILSDLLRTADENNPKGYLEDERVKRLHADHSWIHTAEGKAIKVVAPLLHFLPGGLTYKIIFMERDIDEVLVSQQKMLGKNSPAPNASVALSQAFSKQVEKAKAWIKGQPQAEVLYLNFFEVVTDPELYAEHIAAFLDENLDRAAMVNAVSAELYRNKKM